MKIELIVLGAVLLVLCFTVSLQFASGFYSVKFRDKRNRDLLLFFWSTVGLTVADWVIISVLLINYLGLCGTKAILWGGVAVLSGVIVLPVISVIEFFIVLALLALFRYFMLWLASRDEKRK